MFLSTGLDGSAIGQNCNLLYKHLFAVFTLCFPCA